MFSKEEKIGGFPLNLNLIRAFRDCIDQCGLMIELRFHGLKFTRTNKHPNWQYNIKGTHMSVRYGSHEPVSNDTFS